MAAQTSDSNVGMGTLDSSAQRSGQFKGKQPGWSALPAEQGEALSDLFG